MLSRFKDDDNVRMGNCLARLTWIIGMNAQISLLLTMFILCEAEKLKCNTPGH